MPTGSTRICNLGNSMKKPTALAFAVLLWGGLIDCVAAFDGWHIERAVPIPGEGSSWDYLALDQQRNRLFIGHRAEGLKVFDLAANTLLRVIDHTKVGSSNGATLMPEFDIGVSNNQDGTITPFKLSTLEARAPIKLGAGLDTSHYDTATQRLIVNMDAEKDGNAELVVLQLPALSVVDRIAIPSKKPEHADSDGKGNFFLAARDVDKVFRLDLRRLKITATWSTPGCGQTNGLAIDVANDRLFLGCRGRGETKPSFAVMNASSGAIIYVSEIGGGNDGLIYDRETKRIFLSNSVHAVLNVFEQVDANTYKPLEAMGTRANVRTIAMNSGNKKIYSFAAQGSADYSKPVSASVSPFYANTFFAGTFEVLTFARRR